METRNISITLETAKEWYNSNNETLKEVALQVFTECELTNFDFKSIKTFEDAVRALQMTPEQKKQLEYTIDFLKILREYSSLASLKLNIIRKALNKGHDIKFNEGEIWFPFNYILKIKNKYIKSEKEIEVAKVKINNEIYTLTGGGATSNLYSGLSSFSSHDNMATSNASAGFLGCATEEIAEHFGKYFAKEIFEAKYSDFVNFEWINFCETDSFNEDKLTLYI